jgi:hypothetical protein
MLETTIAIKAGMTVLCNMFMLNVQTERQENKRWGNMLFLGKTACKISV